MDTPSRALAPSRDLFAVPSSAIKNSSNSLWEQKSFPASLRDIVSFTFLTAFITPLPPYAMPPSRISSASCDPVDAPLGTIDEKEPFGVAISAQTVGFPRLSKTCLALTETILTMQTHR